MKYEELKDPFKVPFIFRNCEMTIPANKELKEWLQYMLANSPEELKFLHLKSQEYKAHGGASSYVFKRWLHKLGKDLSTTTFKE